MNEKRIPVEQEEPRHKKKSNKKGRPRANHKHVYKKVVLHSWFDNPFKQGIRNEHLEVCEVCSICGRIGTYITGRFFNLYDLGYNIEDMEHWYVNDYFDKSAKKMEDKDE